MRKIVVMLLLCSAMFAGWFGSDKSVQEQRDEILKMQRTTLQELYSYAPSSKGEIARAYGYAVFSSMGVHILALSNEHGSGVAHNNRTGKDIYMNMLSLGAGFGLGIKDFRAVFIFANKDVFEDFVNNGWEANAQVDAAAKAKDYTPDTAINTAITVAPGVLLYKLTENGLALQATMQGSKYWKDSDLN